MDKVSCVVDAACQDKRRCEHISCCSCLAECKHICCCNIQGNKCMCSRRNCQCTSTTSTTFEASTQADQPTGLNPTTAFKSLTTSDTFATSDTKTSSTATIQSSSTTAQADGSYGPQVVAVAVSVVLAVVVVAVAVVVVVWWRRKRASKSGGGAENAHTNMRESVTDGTSHAHKDNGISTQMNDAPNRNSEHVYTHIDSVTNFRPKSIIAATEDSGYNEADEVTNQKLPTAPEQDRTYSLARKPFTKHGGGQTHSATEPSVYNLAHSQSGETTNTQQYFIIEEERNASFQNRADGGQYFILEDGAATDENDSKIVIHGQNDVAIHDAHEYSVLDASDRAKNSAGCDAEYTPLHDKTGTRPKIPAKIHGGNEYSDLDPSWAKDSAGCGAEYTALEYDSNPLAHADTDTVNNIDGRMHKGVKGKQNQAFRPQSSDGQNKDGHYFILEKGGEVDDKGDAAGRQYFVLEEDAAKADKKDGTHGQYFALEEDTADEDKKEATHGQHRGVKGNGATTGGQRGRGGNHPSATTADEEYSHLDHSGKGGKSDNEADADKDYSHLGFCTIGDSGSNEEKARKSERIL